MTKDDLKTLLIIIATLIVPILSLGIISPLIKISFVLIYSFICFLLLSKLFADKLKTKNMIIFMATVIEILLLTISTLNTGSISGYFERIKNFLVVSQETTSNNIVSSNIDFESYFNDLSMQISEIDKKIEYNLENVHFNQDISEVEINEIINQMEQNYEKYNDYFGDLKTDIYSIELMYKIFISEMSYYYCNILEAFERFGINNDKLGIDENILFVWDIEILYIKYNMKQKNFSNSSYENATGEIYSYDDYRVTMQKYSDTFDYGGWKLSYETLSAKDADIKFNNSIMNYYKKFIINFSE